MAESWILKTKSEPTIEMIYSKDIPEISKTVLILNKEPGMVEYLLNLFQTWRLSSKAFDSHRELLASGPPKGFGCLVACIDGSEKCGLVAYENLKKSGYYIPVVFLVKHPEFHVGVQAMRAGAEDVLPLPIDECQLMGAVFNALDRSKEIAENHEHNQAIHRRVALLTARELEVVMLVVSGKLNKEIADLVGLALVTVKVHRGHAMKKLGARTPADLTRIVGAAGVFGSDLEPSRSHVTSQGFPVSSWAT
jgi:FixJ family two-component response regulator